MKIKKVFIANRGEICLRVAQSVKSRGMGSATLAHPDRIPQYLSEHIDTFVFDEHLNSQTYLNKEQMIAHAKSSGCDAIHPGYGYLSENSDFASLVKKEGLIWIGPDSESMKLMASKSVSRDIAEKNNVPCLQALKIDSVEDIDGDSLQKFADKIGYPVLIKATMGGGGKGMRIVHDPSGIVEAAKRASSEAINAFGDGEIIVEKYLETSRHIEVQILGDGQGRVCAIGDRDCSIQRRHQKIVEEAPAPGLNPDLRHNLHKAACQLASAVNYTSAGTVEFLLDWSESQRESVDSFYFLEMNTRLQVEHPVTEECYGLDLVDWQLRIASGEKLPVEMEKLAPNGHVVEFRIYAEDCDQNFLPAAGPIHLFLPGLGPAIRWDIGLDAIDRISAEYDPMIAKVICKGQDREAAFRTGLKALEDTVLLGGPTNIEFLQEVCRDSEMVRQPVSSDYLGQNKEKLLKAKNKRREILRSKWQAKLDAASKSLVIPTQSEDVVDLRTSEVYAGNFCRQESDIISSCQSTVSVNQKTVLYSRLLLTDGSKQTPAVIAFSSAEGQNVEGFSICGAGFFQVVERSDLDRYAKSSADSGNVCQSPVPGKVVSLNYKAGDKVEPGEVVVILESMKMEFEVKSESAGVIEQVLVQQGQQVESGTVLVEWQE